MLVLYWKSTKNALSRRDNTQIAKSDEKTQKGGYTKFSTSSRFMILEVSIIGITRMGEHLRILKKMKKGGFKATFMFLFISLKRT